MSCFVIYYENGAKMMRPVLTREAYMQLRDTAAQRALVRQVRSGNANAKMRLVQMNYSCLPHDATDGRPAGRLKGSTRMSTTVGMDVDHIPAGQMAEVKQRILDRKDQLGLLMLELSARAEGYHLVFKRRAGLSQEENLRWASQLLDVQFDKGAKDITRVFFTTTASKEDLLYLDDHLFDTCEMEQGTAFQAVTGRGTPNPAAPSVQPVTNPSGVVASSHESGTNPSGVVASSHDSSQCLEGTTSEADSNPVHAERSGECAGVAEPPTNGCLEGTTSENALNPQSSLNPQTPPSSINHKPLTINLNYLGTPYTAIIAKYWELFNDGREPVEGDRNVKTYELAMTLRSICDYDQQMMEQVIPNYWQQGTDSQSGVAEWRQTIENALKEPRKGMPYRLRQVLTAVKEERKMRIMGMGAEAASQPATMVSQVDALPERPEHMPAVLDLLSSKVPLELKAMVEESVWPAMCAHLCGVTFRYIDGVIHEANISSPLIARQSGGKGKVDQPIEHLLADITARDHEHEERLNDWRKRNKGKSQNKDRQPRPEDVVIQRLDVDLTPAALSEALIDAERNGGKRVISKVDEIEMLLSLGDGKKDKVSILSRYGYDTARWGQRRVGLDSVNGSYTVRWVWNASCTPRSIRKVIDKDWIADGTLSRLNVNALLLPKGEREMPKIGDYDDKFAHDLKLYVDRLNAASGLIECPQADNLAEEMKAEHNRIADLCESEGYRIFSYRAVVIGWLKAMILYIANGYKWDESIAQYVAYAVRRDMYLKMYFFGKQIEEEFAEEERQQHTGPQNLLALLPEEFSFQDFQHLRQAQGREGDGKSTLRTWKSRGYIVYDEVTDMYLKRT